MPSSSYPTANSTPTHHAKRPYAGTHSQTQHQATITSYFSAYPSISSTTHQTSPLDSPASSPPVLPPLVQSNLLSVGMRVRKSVPEGYKTGTPKKYTYFSLNWTQDSRGLHSQTLSWDTGAQTSVTAYKSSRELTPFCGILKVGGLAVQQSWDNGPSVDADGEVPDVEDVPFLSSQASTISVFSVDDSRLGNNNKRRFEDGEDEQQQPNGGSYDIWHDKDEEELQLSPKSRPEDLVPQRLGLGLGIRAVAVPKSRRKGNVDNRGGGIKVAVMEGQENVAEVDFGEADFMDWSSCLG